MPTPSVNKETARETKKSIFDEVLNNIEKHNRLFPIMKSTPTATEILEKYFKDCMLVTGDEREAALKAMREIASLTWDACIQSMDAYGTDLAYHKPTAPDKETFLTNLFKDAK